MRSLLFFLYSAIYESDILRGRVSLVTGGSRGIGAGIAAELAIHGSRVYVTARSEKVATEENLGGTLAELALKVNQKYSGKVIPCYCDHNNDSNVDNVINKILADEGRLDILVNNAFQVPSSETDPDLLFREFWEQPGSFWDTVIDVGLRSHYVTSYLAAPLLNKTALRCKSDAKSSDSDSLMPMIFHISSFGGVSYSFNVAYGVGKAGVDRMARDMHKELWPHGIICVSLYPGVVRTERIAHIIDSGVWTNRTGLFTPPGFVESPQLTGRVIAQMYARRDEVGLPTRGGEVFVVAEAAKKLGVTDVTGDLPPSIRSLKFLLPGVLLGKYKNIPAFLQNILLTKVPDVLLPMSAMVGGARSSG